MERKKYIFGKNSHARETGGNAASNRFLGTFGEDGRFTKKKKKKERELRGYPMRTHTRREAGPLLAHPHTHPGPRGPVDEHPHRDTARARMLVSTRIITCLVHHKAAVPRPDVMRREAHAKPVRHRNVSTHAHDRSARFQNVVSQIALARAPFHHHPDPGHGCSCANSWLPSPTEGDGCARLPSPIDPRFPNEKWYLEGERAVRVDFDLVPSRVKAWLERRDGPSDQSRYSLIRFKETLNAKFDLLIDDPDRSSRYFLFYFLPFGFAFPATDHLSLMQI